VRYTLSLHDALPIYWPTLAENMVHQVRVGLGIILSKKTITNGG
jgi:hypothetical protein